MDPENDIQHGEAEFNQGRVAEAQAIFESLLKKDPGNWEALNNLGVIHYSQADLKTAEQFFRQAANAKPDFSDPLINLADIYRKEESWQAAVDVLHQCRRLEPGNTDLLNQLSVIYLELNEVEKARKALIRSLEIDPAQKTPRESLALLGGHLSPINRQTHPDRTNLNGDIEPTGEAQRNFRERDCSAGRKSKKAASAGLKIAFLCMPGLESFLSDIIGYLNKMYAVRACVSTDRRELAAAVQWADIIWLEWGNEVAIHVTNQMQKELQHKKVICRIHSYEVLGGFLEQIQWQYIDKVVFVADHIRQMALDLSPQLSQKTETMVLHNGINSKLFPFKKRVPGFNLAVVNGISFKKNPSMWIEIISRLIKINPQYTLKIAGQFQDRRYQYYLENMLDQLALHNNLLFFGHVADIPDWFDREKINYLLTTSPFESFGYSIGEAMALGCRPLIHAFPGAQEIWPAGCIFKCVDELVDLVLDKDHYDSESYRAYVTERYGLDHQIKQIENLLQEMTTSPGRRYQVSEPMSPNSNESKNSRDQAVDLEHYHNPSRSFIVTGIPRSGTSLFSALLNDLDNVVCLNEIEYAVDSLPKAFTEIRRKITLGMPIPNRYDRTGKLTTDTQGSGAKVDHRIIQGADQNVVIGSKVNIPYLNHIQRIFDYGYKTIAIVRNPVYAIGSWNSPKAHIIPEAHVSDTDQHPRWRSFKFATHDKIERQAQIWNYYAELIWRRRKQIRIYTYEALTSNPEDLLVDLSAYLGVIAPTTITPLKNLNVDSRYPHMDAIRAAVAKYCPIKAVFGYGAVDSVRMTA